MIIIPGPLSETVGELQASLDLIRTFKPPAKVVQIDIVDGEYADTITIEPAVLRDIEDYGFQFDLHLMTVEPIDFVGEVQGLKSLRRVIAQVERMSSVHEFVTIVKEDLGVDVGFALDLYTKIDSVGDDVLDALDQVSVVQIMGNQSGTQGQDLSPIALDTLRQVVEYRNHHGLNFAVAVDIGMNNITIPQVREIGATEVVVGSYVQGPEAAAHWQQLQTV
jgi:pentose-5-phosphate-3-epimerase